MPNWENILTGIGYGLNFLGSMGSNVWNNAISNNANEQQERLQDKANAFSLDMWNRENAYNHPSAQMERLKQAGINPAMAYSNGVQNTAGGAPSSVQPNDTHRAKMENPFSDFSSLAKDLFSTRADEELAKLRGVERENLNQQIEISKKVIIEKDKDLQLKDEQLNVLKKQGANLEKELELKDKEISYYRSLINEKSYEVGLKRLDYEFHRAIKEAKVEKFFAEKGLTESQIKVNIAVMQKYLEEVFLTKSQVRLNDLEESKREQELVYFADNCFFEYENNRLTFNMNKVRHDWFLNNSGWILPFETVTEGLGQILNVGFFGKIGKFTSTKRPKIGF